MRKMYKNVRIEPTVQDMLRDLTKSKNVDKETMCDILSAIVEGYDIEESMFDIWEEYIGTYAYEEVEVEPNPDEAYDRWKDDNL